jgi:hypothetical protein
LLPVDFNYRGIDGTILWVEYVNNGKASFKRILHVIAIQITIAKTHSDSELVFFSGWGTFVTRICGGSRYDEVKPIFLWVVEETGSFFRQPAEVPEATKTTRNRSYTIPAYERRVHSVIEISEKVGRNLETARAKAREAK